VRRHFLAFCRNLASMRNVILLAITACFATIRVTAQSPDEAAIREILRVQTDAWNRGDGVAWAREFTDDSDFVNMRGGTYHGRSEIGARVAANLQGNLKGSHLSMAIRQFSLPDPDVALIETDVEIAGAAGSVPLPGATPEGVAKIRIKYVAVRRNRHWYFIAFQGTPVLPLAATLPTQ
jgi:uncharacterized protein (TIGR02246 family)